MSETEAAYLQDAYLSTMEATLLRIEEGPALVFDRSNFFSAGGGQPGDSGFVETSDGRQIRILDTVRSADKSTIRLLAEDGAVLPEPGETLVLHVDWARRYRLMRMHTACHLLTVVCPYPVTGASVGEEESRIDFDIPDAETDKAAVTQALMALVAANHPVGTRWITDAELDADPSLVKSANVKPPRGSGRIRLVTIGEDGSIDAQPCGGTHVQETSEIGEIHVGKIEKKGKVNRRFRIRFGPLPA
ncbi:MULTISPECIES: alanyl-tRNA editing protein [unclassified Aureimonas]|uniref:alanyl-tRNA editing protein n=1 Tax=unclassified Aureimonas TaxID=2615206 RepID=UPI0006F5F7FD|nr:MULTISPECIES: alanyl-tRNA editing protein [unclassified Aureimonas]KQT60558.1 Ala-tRNA(Pro) hydrolase [Aureimonas sp. Leaf427]KQT79435.1 Ala-tRNA(Pro) hydrolase [Aureimonas sp. Leaf460]